MTELSPLVSGGAASPAVQGEFDRLHDVQFHNSTVPDLSAINHHAVVRGRPAFAVVTLNVGAGDQVLGGNGKMIWMDASMDVNTGCHNGCPAICGRACAGENCCYNMFSGPGRITFGFEHPGNLVPFAVSAGNGWMLAQKSFIAGSSNVVVSGIFPGCGFCCCGGDNFNGLFLIHVSSPTPGLFYAGGFGDIIKHEVPAGEQLVVDNGMFFACHEATNIGVRCLGGCTTFCCGGEGCVLTFNGPCTVFTRTRDPAFFLPRGGNKNQQQQKQQQQGGGGS